MSSCIACNRELLEGEVNIHLQCARKLFRLPYLPCLPYSHQQLVEACLQHDPAQSDEETLRVPIYIEEAQEGQEAQFRVGGSEGTAYELSVACSAGSFDIFVEELVMRMASAARIQVAPHILIWSTDGVALHIVDHAVRGQRRTLLPTSELSQMVALDPAQNGALRCEDVATALSRLSSAPKLDCVNLFERLYFAWLVGDLSMDLNRLRMVTSRDGFISLAPLTKASSAVLLAASQSDQMALSLCGKVSDLSSSDFAEAMGQCGIGEKIVDNMLAKFSAMVDPWCDMIEESHLNEELSERFKFMLFLKG